MATRNLIVCSDGTWNSPYTRDRGVYATSNVLKMVKALRHGPVPDQATEQHVFYDEGVGTGNWLDRLVGGATGAGLEQNVLDGYQFLLDNYQDGDRIYLIGFSRGAYTVRRLAGFICRFGLLKKDETVAPAAFDAAVRALYEQFQQLEPGATAPPRRADHFYPDIEALGVWDTVGALGLPRHWLLTALLSFRRKKYEFIDDRLSAKVHHAYHALALDEPRKLFAPTLWQEDGQHPDLQQVWFAGAHSNVGGGYQEAGLSDTALQWMIEQLRECGLHFRAEYLARAILPDCYGEIRNPRRGLWPKLLYRARARTVPAGSIIHDSVQTRCQPSSLYRVQFEERFKGFSVFQPRATRLGPGLTTNAVAAESPLPAAVAES